VSDRFSSKTSCLLLTCLIFVSNLTSTTFAQGENPYANIEKAYQQGDFDQVIKLSDGYLAKDPALETPLYFRASAKIEKGIRAADVELVRAGIADARGAIEKMKTPQPNYYLPYLYGMNHLTLLENSPEHATTSVTVIDSLFKQLTLTPDQKANFLFQRGQAHLYLDKLPDAEQDFRNALTQVPTHLGAMMSLADALAAQQKYQDADNLYSDAIRATPNSPLGYNNRGMFRQSIDRHDEAIKDFEKAVSLDKNYFVAITNAGFSKLEQSKLADAEKDFTSSLKIQAQQPGVYSLRGTTRLRMGKFDDAIKDYEEVIKYTPDSGVAKTDLAFAYYFKKNFAQAAVVFDEALKLEPQLTHLMPWRYASKILSNKGQEAEADIATVVAKPEADRKWVDYLTLYLSGRVPEDVLLAQVQKEQQEFRQSLLCDANYFIGLRKSNKGDTAGAQKAFNNALATGEVRLSSYRGSELALGK
jgi:tetratricopeptide (TPR) repeat protein